MPAENIPTSALSFQLYSVREALAADTAGTLARVAALGLTKAEAFGFAADNTALVEAAQAAGIATPSVHATVVDAADRDALFAAAAAAGIATVIEPYLPPERWSDAAAVDAIAAELNAAAEVAATHGITVGYHNHAWELSTRIGEQSALEYLATKLDERVVLEVDTYWAQVGGSDPVALLGTLGARVTHIHVKDGDASSDTSKQQPAGSGVLPVREIVAAAPQALPVIEFDDYAGDIFDGIVESIAFLTGAESAR